jgi:hypothetical protein
MAQQLKLCASASNILPYLFPINLSQTVSGVAMVASNKKPTTNYLVGDEISYATGSGMHYGEVVRLLEGGQVRLLRRASGQSELDEHNRDRRRGFDQEIREVMRRDIKR